MNFGWHPDRKPFIVLHLKSDNLAQGNAKAADYPSVRLSNGILDVSVFLPDKDKGYYRSARFEG